MCTAVARGASCLRRQGPNEGAHRIRTGVRPSRAAEEEGLGTKTGRPSGRPVGDRIVKRGSEPEDPPPLRGQLGRGPHEASTEPEPSVAYGALERGSIGGVRLPIAIAVL